MFLKKTIVLVLLLTLAGFTQIDLSGLTMQQQDSKEPVELAITADTPLDADTIQLALTFKMDANIHLYAAESLFFKCTVEQKEGLGEGTINLPEPHPFTNFDKTTVGVYTDSQKILLRYPITSKRWSLKGSVRFQACDTAMCFTPRTISFHADANGSIGAKATTGSLNTSPTDMNTGNNDLTGQLDNFSIVGSKGGYLNVKAFSAFLNDPSGSATATSGGFEEKDIVVIILLILLGGIALNLTPCVLPMIPITIAVIGAGSQAKSRARGMLAGGIYGLAMALTYGILGVAVVVTGTRFGVINSSPLFNIIIAAVFVVMALAMFDIIQIDFTKFRKNGGQGERGKLLTAFFMGIIASLLAGACVAPVVISVVLYAGTLYSQGNLIGLLLPFLLGAGMALPWPFAGAGLSFLPKPGKWMVWVKYVFGIFILVMALYYGYTGIHLLKQNTPPAIEETDHTDTESPLTWHPSLETGLQKAQQEDKPVFIDFWATWCKNCKAMDATTFRDPAVQQLLSGYILVKYQAEHPDEPETKALLNRFKVVGLPTYVVLEATQYDRSK